MNLTSEQIAKVVEIEHFLSSSINNAIIHNEQISRKQLIELGVGHEYFPKHYHICDYELDDKLNNRKGRKKLADKKCFTHLGRKRDEELLCCDYCNHMRYIACDIDDNILYIL